MGFGVGADVPRIVYYRWDGRRTMLIPCWGGGQYTEVRGRMSRALWSKSALLITLVVGLIIHTRLGTQGSESLVFLELNVVMLLPGGSGGNSILWSGLISGVGLPAWNMVDNVRAGHHSAKGLTKFSNLLSRFKSRGSSCESVHACPRRQDPFV
jgi:hypothetical protein